MTVGEALALGRRHLAGKSDSAARDAALLLAFALGKPSQFVYLHPETPVSEEAFAAYNGFLERRASGEPIAYIRGFREFMGHEFLIDRRVLVPRPETELVAETAIRLLSGNPSPLVADICCGSGVIGLSIAKAIPESRVVLSDISREAVDLARENAERLGVVDRVAFYVGDLVEPLLKAGFSGKFDILTANPPYIPTDEIETLSPTIREYEPRIALDGGKSGLRIIRRIAGEVPAVLKPGGRLIMEIGSDQGEACRGIIMEDRETWAGVEVLKDYGGKDRVVVAWTHAT
ncbi:MAG TPA: peptide chain release factor N(5)-glutamine methyltransferase [Firmicutes bacterium]|nr:peptide chain release factor N(5)-glutamine methyltransferase [Candidatus Fermentithermobacillaceae bacterium]